MKDRGILEFALMYGGEAQALRGKYSATYEIVREESEDNLFQEPRILLPYSYKL